MTDSIEDCGQNPVTDPVTQAGPDPVTQASQADPAQPDPDPDPVLTVEWPQWQARPLVVLTQTDGRAHCGRDPVTVTRLTDSPYVDSWPSCWLIIGSDYWTVTVLTQDIIVVIGVLTQLLAQLLVLLDRQTVVGLTSYWHYYCYYCGRMTVIIISYWPRPAEPIVEENWWRTDYWWWLTQPSQPSSDQAIGPDGRTQLNPIIDPDGRPVNDNAQLWHCVAVLTQPIGQYWRIVILW